MWNLGAFQSILINPSQSPRLLTHLNLGGVVLPIVQDQVCETSGLRGVLAQAGSVRIYGLDRIQVPFPPVAECVACPPPPPLLSVGRA